MSLADSVRRLGLFGRQRAGWRAPNLAAVPHVDDDDAIGRTGILVLVAALERDEGAGDPKRPHAAASLVHTAVALPDRHGASGGLPAGPHVESREPRADRVDAHALCRRDRARAGGVAGVSSPRVGTCGGTGEASHGRREENQSGDLGDARRHRLRDRRPSRITQRLRAHISTWSTAQVSTNGAGGAPPTSTSVRARSDASYSS